MAVSGSRNFTGWCNQIVLVSMDLVGARNMGDAALAKEVEDNREILNAFVASLATRGLLMLWARARRTDLYPTSTDVLQNVTTSGTSTYYLGKDVLDILAGSVFQRPSGGYDTQLQPMSHEEYALEGSKSLAGRPMRFLIESSPSYDDSRTIQGRLQIVLHPVPNDSTTVIGYTCIKKLQDFDTQADDADAPPMFTRALEWGLAADLSVKYGLPVDERRDIRNEAAAELERVRGHNTQRGNMRLNPIFPGGWF